MVRHVGERREDRSEGEEEARPVEALRRPVRDAADADLGALGFDTRVAESWSWILTSLQRPATRNSFGTAMPRARWKRLVWAGLEQISSLGAA